MLKLYDKDSRKLLVKNTVNGGEKLLVKNTNGGIRRDGALLVKNTQQRRRCVVGEEQTTTAEIAGISGRLQILGRLCVNL